MPVKLASEPTGQTFTVFPSKSGELLVCFNDQVPVYGFHIKPKLTEEQKEKEKAWILAETDRFAKDPKGKKLERGETGGSFGKPRGYSFDRTQYDYHGNYEQ